MKRLSFLLLCLSLFLVACREANPYEQKEIKSIHYYTVESFIPMQHDRLIDLENLTYSTRVTIQNIDNYADIIQNIDDYRKDFEVVATFTADEAKIFVKNIKKHGMFRLDGDYVDRDITDGNGWVLVVIFTDGTTYTRNGYMKSPPQAKKINKETVHLYGENLFDVFSWE